MDWMQALAIIVSMLGMVGGLGFFFLRVSERLDRNFEEMQKESKEFQKDFQKTIKEIHGRVCILEDRSKQN